METTRTCSECHQPLSPDAPDGLCPHCLMKAAAGPLPNASGDGLVGDIIDIGDPAEVAKKLPQFEILEMLGRGGMGVVYKARQPQLDRIVALKILPPVDALSPDFVARFTREARSLAKLNHPNIVAVYDFGATGGLYYIVMEYVEGANLRQLFEARKLTPAEALAIVPKICDALEYAHEEGLVHRDIKPENLLIDKKGRVKIADFGLAKLLRREPLDMTLTLSGMSLGTLRYMAPEQMDKPETVDHRADLYSLGVVIYEMLTGETPVGRFELPSQKAQVDVRFDEIVLHALEKEPARRYQHASEVKIDVENVSSNPQVAPVPTAAASDAQTFQKSKEKRIILKLPSGVLGFFFSMSALAVVVASLFLLAFVDLKLSVGLVWIMMEWLVFFGTIILIKNDWENRQLSVMRRVILTALRLCFSFCFAIFVNLSLSFSGNDLSFNIGAPFRWYVFNRANGSIRSYVEFQSWSWLIVTAGCFGHYALRKLKNAWLKNAGPAKGEPWLWFIPLFKFTIDSPSDQVRAAAANNAPGELSTTKMKAGVEKATSEGEVEALFSKSTPGPQKSLPGDDKARPTKKKSHRVLYGVLTLLAVGGLFIVWTMLYTRGYLVGTIFDWSERPIDPPPPLGTITGGIGATFTVPAGQVATFEIVTRSNNATVPIPGLAAYVLAPPSSPVAGTFRWAPKAEEHWDGFRRRRWTMELVTGGGKFPNGSGGFSGGKNSGGVPDLPEGLDSAVGSRSYMWTLLPRDRETIDWAITQETDDLPANGLVGFRVRTQGYEAEPGTGVGVEFGTGSVDWQKGLKMHSVKEERSLKPSASATDLLRKVSEKYGALSTFSATGKIVSIETPASGGVATTLEKTFSLNLARPEFYRVQWTHEIKGLGMLSDAAWSAGDGHKISTYGKVSTYLNREQALAAATGVSGGAAHTVPSLFFKDEGRGLDKVLTNATMLPEESVGADLCYVVSGDNYAYKTTFWITKKDLFLKQSRSVHEANSGAGTFHGGEQVSDETLRKTIRMNGREGTPEEVSKARKQMESGRQRAEAEQRTSTTTFETIAANDLLIKEDFEFTVPAAVPAQQPPAK